MESRLSSDWSPSVLFGVHGGKQLFRLGGADHDHLVFGAERDGRIGTDHHLATAADGDDAAAGIATDIAADQALAVQQAVGPVAEDIQTFGEDQHLAR